jgi:hypothetical protein
MLPRKIIANHIEDEKRDRPEQRLKLKIGSSLIKTELVRMSENKSMKNIDAPKSRLVINPLMENKSGKIESIPPRKHAPNSNKISVPPDGKVNSDE